MGGRSGTRVASHTLLAVRDGRAYAITPAQYRLVLKAQATPGRALHVWAAEVRSAKVLELIGMGTLRDDGAFGPTRDSNADGERWFFKLHDGITLRGHPR